MPDDPRLSLALLVSRLAGEPRAARRPLLIQLIPQLSNPAIPIAVRIAAASRVLQILPDRMRPVRRVARSLTRGLPPSRGLECLWQLQSRLEKSDALDRLIEGREKRVKLACPRCRARFPRSEIVKHLWNEHGLSLVNGKARSERRVLTLLQEQHRTTGNREPLDRVAAISGAVGLREWLATEDLPADDLAPLLNAANENRAGLCPSCFAEIPAAVAASPDPLHFAHGRLGGDGYAVEVGGNAWLRTLRLTTPTQKATVGEMLLAPRAFAMLVAGAILLASLFVTGSIEYSALGIGLSWITYLVVRFLRESGETLEDRAVNACWTRLADRHAERPQAARFLSRLCLASVDRGDPESRARTLGALVQRSGERLEGSDEELLLHATARALQVQDLSQYGHDAISGIAALAAEGLSGALPADFAEMVLNSYLLRPRSTGELARLRILLIDAAFEAGLVPGDLIDVWAGAPSLKRAMAIEPAHRLGLLFGVWQSRQARSWQGIGPAETVYDLARNSPPTAARFLARFPDLLLIHRQSREVEYLLGPVLVCARGVVIGGQLTADPDAEIRLDGERRRLKFGRHRIEVSSRLPADLPELLTSWLRYRADVLLPLIDGLLIPGSAETSRRVLSPFCRRCLACGTVSAVSRGTIGRVVTR